MNLLPALLIISVSISSVFAQKFEPAPYELTDGIFLIPQVKTSVRYDDNIYNDEFKGSSSSVFFINPSFSFGRNDGINRYGGSYDFTAASYSYDAADNYVEHRLALLAHTEYTAKHRTDFDIIFNNLHEDRGAGLTEYDATYFGEPLKYNEFTARGYYQFGGLTSIMRIGAGIAYNSKRYRNFFEQTKYSDYDALKFFTDADYKWGHVTFLTFDLYTNDIQYNHLKNSNNSRDNRDSGALVGVRWEGLGKTTGTLKVGYQYKTFASDERENFSGNTVDFGLTWKPLAHSSFTGHLSRVAEDSNTVGDYIETFGASISWKHHWSDRFSSNVQYAYTNQDYIGVTRQDDTNNASLRLNYALTRWFEVTTGYEYTVKDSNARNISYDKNAFNLGIVVSL